MESITLGLLSNQISILLRISLKESRHGYYQLRYLFFLSNFCSFFSYFKDLLEKISEEELSKNKGSLIAKLLEKDKTLVAQINRFLSEFTFPRRHSFNRRMFSECQEGSRSFLFAFNILSKRRS